MTAAASTDENESGDCDDVSFFPLVVCGKVYGHRYANLPRVDDVGLGHVILWG